MKLKKSIFTPSFPLFLLFLYPKSGKSSRTVQKNRTIQKIRVIREIRVLDQPYGSHLFIREQ